MIFFDKLDEETKEVVDIQAYNNAVRIKTLGMQFALQFFYNNYKSELEKEETKKDKRVYILFSLSVLERVKSHINTPSKEDRDLFNSYIKKLIDEFEELMGE